MRVVFPISLQVQAEKDTVAVNCNFTVILPQEGISVLLGR